MDTTMLERMLQTDSVSGNEESIQQYILNCCKPFADQQFTDPAGNTLSVINAASPFKVLLSAHADEIGFHVTHIDDKGLVHIQKAGGVQPALYIGSLMQIIHRAGTAEQQVQPGVCAVDDELFKKTEVKDTDLLIDIGAASREEALKVIAVGDPVCARSEVALLLNDRISSRALDDKAGVFVILNAAAKAAEQHVPCGVYVHTSAGEETTGIGAYYAAAKTAPDCAVVVDVTWASDCPGSDPAKSGDVRLGGGPVLCKSGMVNKRMNALLETVARKHSIPVQYEVAGGETYTDGDIISLTHSGVPIVLVSIPLRYMHSSVEVASLKDIEACIDLIAAFLGEINAGFNFNSLSV